MNIWIESRWEKTYSANKVRKGLRLISDQNVDSEVKRACKDFCKWLRSKYIFPIRIPVYLKSSPMIKAMDGDMVYGTFFEPDSHFVEPYVRIATGDYADMVRDQGKDNALAAILHSIAHELTHYFQWINAIALTESGYERQAKAYANKILEEYAQTREHP
mgnify:FL=1